MKTYISVSGLVGAVVVASLGLASISPVMAESVKDDFFTRWMPRSGMVGSRMGGDRLCDPGAVGIKQWRFERLERELKPTEGQMASLVEFKLESVKAAKIISDGCSHERSQSPSSSFSVIERRLTVMLEAVKVVQPSFERFYVTLTDRQKAKLNRMEGSHHNWFLRWMPWSR